MHCKNCETRNEILNLHPIEHDKYTQINTENTPEVRRSNTYHNIGGETVYLFLKPLFIFLVEDEADGRYNLEIYAEINFTLISIAIDFGVKTLMLF